MHTHIHASTSKFFKQRKELILYLMFHADTAALFNQNNIIMNSVN